MDVGVNYPWFEYGWDFGDGPQEWTKGSDPKWYSAIDYDLKYFNSLKLRVVRWFIFGDGLTYGSGKQAPQKGQNGEWRFAPPDLSDNFQVHFQELVDRFSEANKKFQQPIQLIPVLLDFHFCEAGSAAIGNNNDWIKGGRSDIINDTGKMDKFFKGSLRPLLDIAKVHPSVIFAWDIFNEPEWVTAGWHPDRNKKLPVAAQKMREFMEGAMDYIHSAGFKATIGFNMWETIQSSRLYSDYNQFHHYSECEKRLLVPNRFGGNRVWMLGEFASSLYSWNRWKELAPEQKVYDRLKHVESKGYPWALTWAYRSRDCNTSWVDAEEGIMKYFGIS
jgi:hypothetical protein